MSARRLSSTPSLSRSAKNQQNNNNNDDEDLASRSLDFCNAFWGIADGGYNVLLARIRGSVRMTEELRNFWKERAAIEEDYAKRLARLAKQALGRDELGELRNAIDVLRAETERQAVSHANLAQTMRKELEDPIAELSSKQAQFKKGPLALIERSYKAKSTQETYVQRARQKYEEDCVRINSYTAQSTLVQGRELDRIQTRLDKTRQTVQSNERDYASYARALAETTARWEKEWKAFCDLCQDIEEERIEFIKDNIWAYANAVSTVCVLDDESCEKTRICLEQVEAEKDVEAFAQDYTTGPQIPDPLPFVDYNSPNAAQQQSRQTYRLANFVRSSNRVVTPSLAPSPAGEAEPAGPGQAGVGAVGTRVDSASISRPGSAAAKQISPITNGGSSTAATSPLTRPQIIQGASSQSSSKPSTPGSSAPIRPRAQDPLAEHIDPRAQTVLKIGGNTYPVSVGDDPQQARANVDNAATPVNNIGDQDDPVARKMEELRSGSVRKNTPNRRSTIDMNQNNQQATSGSSSTTQPSAAAAPYNAGRAPSPAHQVSPTAPTAKFMRPPSSRSPSPFPMDEVVNNYQQRLPGEKTSPHSSINRGRQPGPQPAQDAVPRAVSPAREGFAGIGAGSRSPSPMPGEGPAMSSPQQQSRVGYNQQTPAQGPARSATVGIEIDPNGQVRHDDLALRFRQQQQTQNNTHYQGHTQQPSQGSYDLYNQQPQQQQRAYQQQPTAQPQQNYYPSQQRTNNPPPPNTYPQQQAQSVRGNMGTVATSNTFQASQPPVHQQHAGYGYDQPPHQTNPGFTGYQAVPANGYQQQPTTHDYNNGYSGPNPIMDRSPSPGPPRTSSAPPPTGQYTEAGEPVLFYVKALYDYQATINEEFDFQAEDIIAVTATPEDGWWSGELLDERRRVPGRTIFPSNFVALLA